MLFSEKDGGVGVSPTIWKLVREIPEDRTRVADNGEAMQTFDPYDRLPELEAPTLVLRAETFR